MSSVVYSKEKIEPNDLHQFAGIALNVLSSTPYGRKYKDSLVMIALCQGGANHYVVTNGYARRYFCPKSNGLKDIDVWFFFRKQEFHPMWHQTRDFGPGKFGHNPQEPNYIGRRMDFYGRSIPFLTGDTVQSALVRWLNRGAPKSSPYYLSQKAVVALFPEDILGNAVWVNLNLR